MATKGVKTEIRSSITPDDANNGKDLPRSARRQFECSKCRKNFNYMKTMEKHKVACKGNTSSLVQMEHAEDKPKDTLLGTEDSNRKIMKITGAEVVNSNEASMDDSTVNKTNIKVSKTENTQPGNSSPSDPESNVKTSRNISNMECVCSKCHKVFSDTKSLVNHILVCTGNSGSPAQMESQNDMQNDALHYSEDINQEIKIVIAPLDAAMLTSNTAVPETLASAVSRVASKEVEALISKDEPNEKPSNEGEKKLNVPVIFPTISALKQHLQNPPNKHRCNICDATFPEAHLLQEHHNRHLEIKKQSWTQCHLCFRSYQNRTSLLTHLNSHTSRFKCEHCGKKFQSGPHLEVHIRRHLGIKTHQCTICNKAFVSPFELTTHMASHQKIQKSCDICRRTFSNNITLKKHRNIHLHYKCDLCKDAFLTSHNLATHRNLRHTSLQMHKPDACRQNSANDTSFEDESTNASNDARRNASDEMEMLYKSDAENPEAGNEHVPGSGYKCPFCPKVYLDGRTRNAHLNTHTNRFKCEHCNKRFWSASHLKQHSKSHLRIMEKIETKSSQLIDIQTEEPASNVAVVEIKVPDTLFEDAICFEDDNEYKPIINVADDVTEAKIYNSDLESHTACSSSGSDNISMVKIFNESTNENTEHPKEVQISAVTFCPIKAEAEDFEDIEIQNKFHTHYKKKSMSEEIDYFDGTQNFQPIEGARGTPDLDGKVKMELSDNLEFLSEDEAPEPIECDPRKKMGPTRRSLRTNVRKFI